MSIYRRYTCLIHFLLEFAHNFYMICHDGTVKRRNERKHSITINMSSLLLHENFLHIPKVKTDTNTYSGIQSASSTLKETTTREFISLGAAFPQSEKWKNHHTSYRFISINFKMKFIFWNREKRTRILRCMWLCRKVSSKEELFMYNR